MHSYCVKCKGKTDTENITVQKTKNSKYILKGICSVCGSRKSRFISAQEGERALSS